MSVGGPADLPDDGLVAALRFLPDEYVVELRVRAGDLRKALAHESGERELSAKETAKEFGHSPTWWSRAAPQVPGAHQASEGAPWSFPIRGIRAYLAGRQVTKRKGRKGPRGPNRSTDPTDISTRQDGLLRHGSAEVGRRAADATRPIGPRLAEAG